MQIAESWSSVADFLTVYIKEAHPKDGWQVDANETDSVCYAQPKTLEERRAIAADFKERFHYPLPLLVDTMDNTAEAAYAAWPERLYVIGADGKLLYKGAMGPKGFAPDEVDALLRGLRTP